MVQARKWKLGREQRPNCEASTRKSELLYVHMEKWVLDIVLYFFINSSADVVVIVILVVVPPLVHKTLERMPLTRPLTLQCQRHYQ